MLATSAGPRPLPLLAVAQPRAGVLRVYGDRVVGRSLREEFVCNFTLGVPSLRAHRETREIYKTNILHFNPDIKPVTRIACNGVPVSLTS